MTVRSGAKLVLVLVMDRVREALGERKVNSFDRPRRMGRLLLAAVRPRRRRPLPGLR
ncbi:hypothetical protein ACWEOG_21000 [Amycolatopsis japonica]